MLLCSERQASAARSQVFPRIILPSASLLPPPCCSLPANGLQDGDWAVWSAAPSISRRRFSSGTTTRASASTMEKAAAKDTLPDRLLTAALPTNAKAARVPGLASRAVLRTEPIGPLKALAQRWIKSQCAGVRRAFEITLAYNCMTPKELLLNVLALMAGPKDPFFGVSLPAELPHGSHPLDVATDALAALCDYSKFKSGRFGTSGLPAHLTVLACFHPSSHVHRQPSRFNGKQCYRSLLPAALRKCLDGAQADKMGTNNWYCYIRTKTVETIILTAEDRPIELAALPDPGVQRPPPTPVWAQANPMMRPRPKPQLPPTVATQTSSLPWGSTIYHYKSIPSSILLKRYS
ncbi:hypothetical protein PCANC_24826 [Puccinia coronata f. sp. avenae]|uniref:Uncharacterized protein n=1 Tax=Puccinia coronata f. sp. avenae TaxID=200324 RepID=A0A2N5TJM7_9BASI|nr:hypothetical protein PCANC_24826 [Puccinia coronata f. sp. avenae]